MGKNRTRFGCRPSGPFVTDSAPEFDAYSAEYGAGMENPVKALIGEFGRGIHRGEAAMVAQALS